MASSPANNDVITEILTYLPMRSLLRFKRLSKFWLDVIDSPNFRKLHKNNEDDTVLLAFDMLEKRVEELLVIDLDERGQSSSLKLNTNFPTIQKFFNDYASKETPDHINHETKVVGPVNGLICITHQKSWVPIAVCNPFLDELKNLPISPISLTLDEFIGSRYFIHDIGIGFDKDDYKVVQLLSLPSVYGRRRVFAEVYSARTNSWRAVGDGLFDQALDVDMVHTLHSPSCKPSSAVHWLVLVDGAYAILTFDVENEVFRTRMLPDCTREGCVKIYAKDDDTFLLLRFCDNSLIGYYGNEFDRFHDNEFDREVRIYESRSCQGNDDNSSLSWNYVASVPFSHPPTFVTPWRRDCMVLNRINFMRKELCIYDYRARKFIGSFVLPRCWRLFKIFQYQGTFVSP